MCVCVCVVTGDKYMEKWENTREIGPSSWSKGLSLGAHILFPCTVISSVQSLSPVWLFVTPWTAAHQASLSIINTRSPPKPVSIESVMPSSHLIFCRPLLLLPSIFPASGSFQKSQLFASGGQSIGASTSASTFMFGRIPPLKLSGPGLLFGESFFWLLIKLQTNTNNQSFQIIYSFLI